MTSSFTETRQRVGKLLDNKLDFHILRSDKEKISRVRKRICIMKLNPNIFLGVLELPENLCRSSQDLINYRKQDKM